MSVKKVFSGNVYRCSLAQLCFLANHMKRVNRDTLCTKHSMMIDEHCAP